MASCSAVLALVGIAACSFHDSPPAPAGGGDGPGAVDAPVAIDTPLPPPPDAKVFLDGAQTVSGFLSVTPTSLGMVDINLANEGTVDWAHWGLNSATTFDRKSGGTAISNVAVIGGGSQLGVTATAVSASWTNGTPDASATQTGTGTGTRSPSALRITVPADVAQHTLRVYVGNRDSSGRLDVALSDGSANAYTNTQTGGTPASHTEYAITYNAASAGQTLTVTWTDTGDVNSGFVMLLSATLQ